MDSNGTNNEQYEQHDSSWDNLQEHTMYPGKTLTVFLAKPWLKRSIFSGRGG